MLLHPNVAYRDCSHCLLYLYDEESGQVELKRDRSGPRERDKSCQPPCQTSLGCKKGTPEQSKSLSEKNWLAYQHYQECRAVGQFPDDATVRRNAGLIRMVEDQCDKARQMELMMLAMTSR